METVTILKQIANDVSDIKKKLVKIEEDIGELDIEIHEIKPEYIEKLKKIDSGRFLSEKEFEKELDL